MSDHWRNQPRAPKGTEEGGRWVSDASVVNAVREAAELDRMDTQAMYRREDGSWDPERAKLHQEIIDSFFEGKTPVENPEVYIVGGGMGAGKTTVLKSGQVDLPENMVWADGDAIKFMLPEMKEALEKGDPNGAGLVHEESSYLSKKIAYLASKGKYNLIMDGTGNNTLANLTKKVNSMREGGQVVNAIYVTLDTDEAWRRALQRAERTGRYVPKAALFESHRMVSKVFPEAVFSGLFDSFKLFDNNTPGKPRIIAEGEGTNLRIKDKSAWDLFLEKGK